MGESQQPPERERLSDDLLDKYFETFKQLTTLNLAAAVLAIAILKDQAGGVAKGLGAPVVVFILSLVVALNGMHVVLRYQRGVILRAQIDLSICFGGSVGLFLLGLALVGSYILY